MYWPARALTRMKLPRRVMTAHPAAVDASPRTTSGGSLVARKYSTCGPWAREARIGPGKNAPECRRNQVSMRANTFRDERNIA